MNYQCKCITFKLVKMNKTKKKSFTGAQYYLENTNVVGPKVTCIRHAVLVQGVSVNFCHAVLLTAGYQIVRASVNLNDLRLVGESVDAVGRGEDVLLAYQSSSAIVHTPSSQRDLIGQLIGRHSFTIDKFRWWCS